MLLDGRRRFDSIDRQPQLNASERKTAEELLICGRRSLPSTA
jgi:hypothetical protein